MRRKMNPYRLLTKVLLCLTIFFTIFISCKKECENTNLITNQDGIVKIFSCGLGCQQVLISISNELYYPVTPLPYGYVNDEPLEILSAEILTKKREVYKPNPDAQGTPLIIDFWVKQIIIYQISK